MKIARIDVWKIELPLLEGSYKWSSGRSVEVFDSTLVRLEADDGTYGWGEVCPLGPFYLPAYGPGARAGIKELGPQLIGLDPRDLARVNDAMDKALLGHNYVKSPLDMACWDLLGKAAGLPAVTLLGGRFGIHQFVGHRVEQVDLVIGVAVHGVDRIRYYKRGRLTRPICTA